MAEKAKGKRAEARKPGRPSRYKPELHPLLAEAWAAAGKTDDEIADILGVARSTVAKWKGEHPEFSDALKRGKANPDEQVERSLFQRAVGYSFDSEKLLTVSDGQGEGSHVERHPIVEHCPPDVTAQIFWLKNRRPDRWRDRHELTGAGGGPLEVVELTPEQRQARLAEILSKAKS